jgi:hypothetical protein
MRMVIFGKSGQFEINWLYFRPHTSSAIFFFSFGTTLCFFFSFEVRNPNWQLDVNEIPPNKTHHVLLTEISLPFRD